MKKEKCVTEKDVNNIVYKYIINCFLILTIIILSCGLLYIVYDMGKLAGCQDMRSVYVNQGHSYESCL